MLKGRLGLDTARVPYKDRHGLMALSFGNLAVRSGTLEFTAAKGPDLDVGIYEIPYQGLTCLLLGPGTTISHDALRLCARHGTGVVATGLGGVRLYASMPFGPDRSALARRQAEVWANPTRRMRVARRMYAWRLGEVLPADDLAALRGIEGQRVKRRYALAAEQFGIVWRGRRYDRDAPDDADEPNRALNHATAALRAMASISVATTGAVPQLGFIHEASGVAFCLDIADLFREELALQVAFSVVAQARRTRRTDQLEAMVRREMAARMRKTKALERMIDRIKELFDADDGGGDA